MSFDFESLNNLLEKANRILDRFEQSRNYTKTHSIDENAFAYRWSSHCGLTPIMWEKSINREDLLHVDKQAELLFANTEYFIKNLPANNALLWGARGTGKSSLIQAVLAEFSQQLKIIEIDYRDFDDWPLIVEHMRKYTKYKFIIFCDDLSFNEDDETYRAVKAALDGSLTGLPNNALIYATSNRRHLLPEKLADNLKAQHIDGEIHHAEAVEEAISLSDRFGLWLSFHALTQTQYLNIVEHWLTTFGINQAEDEYRELALRWALQRGSRSGRIANQFARNYAGNYLLEKNRNN